MIIKMLETRRASEDCFTVTRYVEGGIYDVADSLAGYLTSHGSARVAREDDVDAPATLPDYF